MPNYFDPYGANPLLMLAFSPDGKEVRRLTVNESGELITTGAGGGGGGTADPIEVTPTRTIVSVGTSSTTLAAANPARRYLGLINLGSTLVNFNLGGTPVAGQDWPLAAAFGSGQGGSFFMETGIIYQGAIYGIATGSASNVVVIEG